jgi:two-component system chemotaxis sensor kinase CheA
VARHKSPRTLDDAAARLVQLEPDDRAGAAEVAALLQEVASGQRLPLAVQDLVGRAVWQLLDLADGTVAEPSAAMVEIGQLLEQALSEVDAEPTSMPRESAPAPTVADEPASSAGAPAATAAPPAPAPPRAPAGPPREAAALVIPPDADRELLADFLNESAEYVAQAEESLLALETDPDDPEAINTIFRAFHTVKGTSAFVGLHHVSEMAHRAESFLARIRDGEIPCRGGFADLALRAADMIKELLALVRAGGGPVPAAYADLTRVLEAPEAHGVSAGPAEPATQPAYEAVATAVAESNGRPPPVAAATAQTSVRIRTDRLDRLIDMVGELVIAQAMVAQDERVASEPDSQAEGLSRKVVRAGKIVRELQDLSLSMRMVPLRATFQRLARAVRDVARASGKQVELVADGEETEIDRNMVDVLADPLLHMIRNAVDHGIESPGERAHSGKPELGTIKLRAFHSGSSVVVEMSDDGRGLDRERILAKARARGLVPGDAAPSDSEVYALIFEPGFSTAERVTDVSGRGVGMDVVRRAADSLRGRVDITSEPGRGTTFALRLPLTLAITDGMLVRVGAERYVIPTINIHMTFQPLAEQLSTVAGRGELVMLRRELLPIFRLHNLFTIDGAVTDPVEALLVVVDDGERRAALLVDELLGQQQVVAKSLGRFVGRVDGVSGSAILGDGRVGLILDPADLATLARRLPTGRNGATTSERSTTVSNGTAPSGAPRVGGGKFLTFFLDEEEYGLEILKVQEIIGLLPITRVPRTPPFVRGVINLRGKVIPVTDLRLKFGLAEAEATAETCIVVVRANDVELGLVVDRVSEVLDIVGDNIDPAPAFGADVNVDYILGIGKAEGKVKLLLDIDRVLSTQDVVELKLAAAGTADTVSSAT